MKRALSFLVLIPLCLILLSQQAAAATDDALREFSGTDSLWEAIQDQEDREDINRFLKEESPSGSLSLIWEKLLSALSCGLQDSIDLFCGTCTLLLASVLFEHIKKSFGGGMESAFDLLFLLAAAYFCYRSLDQTISLSATALKSTNAFMLAFLPISAVLLTMMGQMQGAAVQNAHLTFVITAVSTFTTHALFALVRYLFCFSFLEGIGEGRLTGIIDFVQKTVKRLCVFFFTVISTLLALRGALASAADSLTMRSVRFAAGNFIPVVGTLVGENTKTLTASFQLVKTECGVVALAVLLTILLQPVLTLILQKTFLSFAAGVGEILGEERCRRFFKAFSRLYDLILALMISHGCYLIFTITLFLKAKGNL